MTSYDPRTATYDAENRIVSLTSASNGNAYFAYDGEGRRVEKVWTPYGGTTATTYYVYDAHGDVAAEYSDQTLPTAATTYVFTDLLGSVRAVSSSAGSLLECDDYTPFGRLLGSGNDDRPTGCYPTNPDLQLTSKLPDKFTGKERDQETGLDFFEARYMSSAQGRFTSTDPLMMAPHKVTDPQNWNLYSYAGNNPLRFTDPSGEDIEEVIDKDYWKRYQRWKKDYLSTEAGRQQWERYANDPNFLLRITIDKKHDRGAEAGDYQFDPNTGQLTGATIALGRNIGSGYPDSSDYPVTSSLKAGDISGTVVAVTKFAHEFGHVKRHSGRGYSAAAAGHADKTIWRSLQATAQLFRSSILRDHSAAWQYTRSPANC